MPLPIVPAPITAMRSTLVKPICENPLKVILADIIASALPKSAPCGSVQFGLAGNLPDVPHGADNAACSDDAHFARAA
jgi:hypothetical protein